VALVSSHALRHRLNELRVRYSHERRIAHQQAVEACMVQLDEVEAYAEEQEAALLHDRAQLATFADKP
jgi:hypothetical protein